MAQLAFDLPKHKNGNASHGRRERDLTRRIADLEADAKQEIIDGKQRLSRLSARLASFEPSTRHHEE